MDDQVKEGFRLSMRKQKSIDNQSHHNDLQKMQEQRSENLQFPRISKNQKEQLSLNHISFKMNKVIKLLQQKNENNFTNKNKSLPYKNLQKVNHIKQFRNATTLTKVNKKPTLINVIPKIYQIHDKKQQIRELPRIRPGALIPQLEPARILDGYKIISHVGKGCFSVVSAAIDKNSNKKVAIKTYNRIDQMDDTRLKNIQSQVQNLFDLTHQNIISLKHAVRDGRKIQLIMENGGQQSLSGLLRKTTSFEELTAKRYFRQMAEAVSYCHNNNICHRDLKLENILIDDHDRIKLIDFGFSLKCTSKMRLTSFCGTPPYMSPQLAGRVPYNGLSSDIWALGVTLYLMLTGKFPFKAGNEKQLYRLIQQGKYKCQNIPSDVKSLLDSMLRVDEKSRITAQQIMNSDWLKMNQKI